MAEVAFALETEWLQTVLADNACDVFFCMEVDEALRREGMTRLDVYAFLRSTPVCFSSRGDTGWIWSVEGEDGDGRFLRVMLEVETNVIRIDVLEVAKE